MSARTPAPDSAGGTDAAPAAGVRTRRTALRSAYRVVREKAKPPAPPRAEPLPEPTAPSRDETGRAAQQSAPVSARDRMLAMAAAACAEPGARSAGAYGAYASVGRDPRLASMCGRVAAPASPAAAMAPAVVLAPSRIVASSRPGSPYRILVVEDDPDLLAILRTAAELHGHEVIVATDGAQALEALRTLRPDLVLLDLMLPVVDGYRVLSSIRSHSQVGQVPVVVVSARASDGERALGLQMGATDYVIKPYDVRDVMGRVQTLMDHDRGALAAH